ncbi:hypothetical protein C1645_744144 [Glomus cerebriforme]|uniref:Uncharacterized protein n=1 Tax=Glomus cerebriforme TaxID=658196 RepID=A0A397S8Y1_9GLOM|nr:hypothetical protein C1645_744144 [Glomus cerebriforme]
MSNRKDIDQITHETINKILSDSQKNETIETVAKSAIGEIGHLCPDRNIINRVRNGLGKNEAGSEAGSTAGNEEGISSEFSSHDSGDDSQVMDDSRDDSQVTDDIRENSQLSGEVMVSHQVTVSSRDMNDDGSPDSSYDDVDEEAASTNTDYSEGVGPSRVPNYFCQISSILNDDEPTDHHSPRLSNELPRPRYSDYIYQQIEQQNNHDRLRPMEPKPEWKEPTWL